MEGGAWWATVHGVAKSWTGLSNFTFTLGLLISLLSSTLHMSDWLILKIFLTRIRLYTCLKNTLMALHFMLKTQTHHLTYEAFTQSLVTSLASTPTTLPCSLQVSGPNGLLEHGEGSLDLGLSIVPIPSAYNCAPHHFMADIFPSSRYSLLRKFLECKVPMAAMKILLDVQKHSWHSCWALVIIAVFASKLSLPQSMTEFGQDIKTDPLLVSESKLCLLPAHMFRQGMKESESEVTQLCPTLCDPMDCSLPGFSVHGIFQARLLEWVAISFSRRSSWPRDWIFLIVGRRFTVWATRQGMTTLFRKPGIWEDGGLAP